MTKYNSPLEAIVGLTQSATKQWTRQRKAEERQANAVASRYDRLTRSRRINLKSAAWEVMPEAYAAASANGRLPANARQIYYTARPRILALTGKSSLDSAYFTQALLPGYLEAHPGADWDVVYDARGHFIEPHTGREIPLGTLSVRAYLRARPDPGLGWKLHFDPQYPTYGPQHRYRTVLFIEKEGFGPLLETAQIAARFDIAIMSTKGMSVVAARELVDGLSSHVDKILVLHDFDIAGFSIFGTLGGSSRRYRFAHKIRIVDFGLRLPDVRAMKLESEPVAASGSWDARSETLTRHGATKQEIKFLQYQRVKLNAMRSDQLVAFLERKFAEHGVEKVIPEIKTLTRQWHRRIEQRLLAEQVEKWRKRIADAAAKVEPPPDLKEQLQELLTRHPTLAWDIAVDKILVGDEL
jgi:hypothetical protein